MKLSDFLHVVPAAQMRGEDEAETRLLHEMLQEAISYVEDQSWARSVHEVYYGGGVGGVIGTFLFHFESPIHETDEWLWVICGDLPTAYLVCDAARTGADAVELYCHLMQEWVNAVETESGFGDVFPVNTDPTRENASQLQTRIDSLREQVVPWMRHRSG